MKKPLSGFGYPNKMGLIYLNALEEVLGRNGINAILHLADMDEFIGHYPSDNLGERTSILYISPRYTKRWNPSMEPEVVEAWSYAPVEHFSLPDYAILALFQAQAIWRFKVLPLSTKLKVGVPAIARVFTTVTDQISNVFRPE